MPAGQRRDGLVRAHGRDGLAALLRHGHQHVPHVLVGKSEGLAQLRALRIRIFLRPPGGLLQVAQAVHALAEPVSVGKHPGELLLDLLRPGKAPGAQVGHQQIARAQPPAAHDVLVLLVQHARLGGQDQAIVPRQRAAHGAQAVAVQRGANHVAVGVEHRCGAVPGLHHGGIVAVQILPGRVIGLALPGLRQQHHARQRQRHAVHRQELHRVVQHHGVRAAHLHHRIDLLHIFIQRVGVHGLLAGQHAVGVAADGVDLAVMQQHPVGMGLGPAGLGVGGEAGVHHRQRGGVVRVAQVVVEGAQLGHQHHALVDDGAAGQGAHICPRVLLFKAAAQHVQLAVEGQTLRNVLRSLDKALHDGGHRASRTRAQNFRAAGHVAPADQAQSLLRGGSFHRPLDLFHFQVFGHKEHANAVIAGIPQLPTVLCGPGGEQSVGKLRQHAHAVARGSQGVAAGAVCQALHDRQRVRNRLMTPLSGQIHHGANAAGFMFHLRIVEWVLFHGKLSPFNMRRALSVILMPRRMLMRCRA